MILQEMYRTVVIKIIGAGACNSGKVTKVDLKNTKIIEIQRSAFIYCSNLTEVIFPDSLLTLEGNIFNSCSLKNIRIPKSTKNADGYAFNQQQITCFEVDDKNKYFSSENCFWMNKEKTKLIRAPITLTYYYEIPNFENLESNGCFALTNANIHSFVATNK